MTRCDALGAAPRDWLAGAKASFAILAKRLSTRLAREGGASKLWLATIVA